MANEAGPGWVGGNNYLTEEQMQTNATQVFNWANQRGWTYNAIAAILGNMESESNINPNLWESLTVNPERGYGLTQWTPATKLINWCAGQGLNFAHGDSQLARIQWELENGEQWFRNPKAPIKNPPLTFAEWSVSNLPVSRLANYFLWYYEHPAETIQPVRAEHAAKWYKFITGLDPEPDPDPYPTPGAEGGNKILFMLKPFWR